MTNYLTKPQANDVATLSGKIENLRCTRASASFVFTEDSQEQFGVVAVAAALVGMGGQAASIVSAASDVEESADYLEFQLGDQRIKGWVWRSPFQNGDHVTIAAKNRGEYFEVYGIARPVDRTIALYPHCSRSKGRHVRNAIKWWLIFNLFIFLPVTLMTLHLSGAKVFLEPAVIWFNLAMIAFTILMFTSLTRQYMPFVRVAQKIFVVLGLPDAKNIDLVKSSNEQRTDADPPEFGTFYFRY